MVEEMIVKREDERLEWTAPAITEWSVSEETRAGIGLDFDGSNYS